ncbi:MAG: hypothetical protein J6W42_08310 [Bacteroidaceae bacterium]|nr:hypothetical protein [Bacteroidaceae bacterium]
MSDLEGKKLLILGGNPETIPLVEIAKGMGIKTIVTSSVPQDPAKKVAWKSFDVNGMDVPAVVSLARQEQVDGVLVGVADILVPAYCKVCDALGVPSYATQQIVDIFSYKDVFKATCERFGVHGVPEYYLDENLNPSDISRMKFPVMVKPVDGRSGMGMTVCYKAEELKEAVAKALEVSHCKRFIVERYMGECEDCFVYYTFKDGYCSLSGIADRYTTDEQPGLSRVCLGATYPSKYIKNYFSRMHDNAVRMFKNIGIKNGVLLMQAFYEDGDFYVYDPGFRLQGEAPHLHMKAVNGFDQREMLIRFALTGSEGDVDLTRQDDPYFRGKYAATLWTLLKQGKVAKIQGLEEADKDPRVHTNIQRIHEGDTVQESWIGTEKQVLNRLYIVCDTKQQLVETVKEYQDKIKVFDENGNLMTLRGFDVNRI